MTTNRPTLLNGCAAAATAAEARFRIDIPVGSLRDARVVALDEAAGRIVAEASRGTWDRARFFPATERGPDGRLLLVDVDDERSALSDEFQGADVVVMVATDDQGAATAHDIGEACWRAGVTTAGVITGGHATAALGALRPHARVLVVSDRDDDLTELLHALRA